MTLCLLLFLAAVVPAQGNQHDLALGGQFGGLPHTGAVRALTTLDSVEVNIYSPGGTLLGQPFLLLVDVVDPHAPPHLDLPGEPAVLGVSPNALPLANGFGGPELLVFAPTTLQTYAFGIILPAPPLPAPTRVVFQGLAADPTAPNGLAVTDITAYDTKGTPTIQSHAEPLGILAQYGYGLAVKDIDGDTVPDILSGTRMEDQAVTLQQGSVFSYAGVAPNASFVVQDPLLQMGSEFGSFVDGFDIDGDGHKDLMVGARLTDQAQSVDEGAAYVFYGPGFTSTETLMTPAPGTPQWFGHWMAAGDIDGDGSPDIVVSSPHQSVGGSGLLDGVVHVFWGPSHATQTTIPNPFPGGGGEFGYRIVVEDFNQDGFADVAVSHPFQSLVSGNDRSGAVSLFLGPTLNTLIYVPNPAPTPNNPAFMGTDMVSADLDQDGFPDLIVGAELDDSGGITDQGSVLILHGPLFSTIDHVFSPNPGQGQGFGSGVAAGDANGDGYLDLFVGEFFSDTASVPNTGRAWILLGPEYQQGYMVSEPHPGSNNQFGRRVRAGDLNGDGWDDMVVGTPFSSAFGASRQGAVYSVFLP